MTNPSRPLRPDHFLFRIGGFTWSDLRVQYEDAGLHVQYSQRGSVKAHTDIDELLQPEDDTWAAFWAAVEEASVYAWEEDYYDNPEVVDGVQWTLEIERGQITVETGGSNAYPHADGSKSLMDRTPAFEEFTGAIAKLIEPVADDVQM